MPKSSQHALLWSEERHGYELKTRGQLQRYFQPEEEASWLVWLAEQTAFSFRGYSGRMSVVKEVRSRGAGYWYAYSTRERQTRKRYLGPTAKVSLARLEEVALTLADVGVLSPIPQQEELPNVLAIALGVGDGSKSRHIVSSHSYEASLAQQPFPLLTAKLSRPRLPTTLVKRERLLLKLDSALAHPLTLISASGGWGKTMLLSTWAAYSSRAIAWLSLDEMDNDPTRFWSAVIVALRGCHPGIGATAFTMLHTPQAAHLLLILTTLLNELASLTDRTVLILDDYHLIEEQAIHESVLYFLEHLPEPLRLVLSSRVDPPLPLSLLRVRGHMSEIRDIDLRFQRDDAAQFLNQGMGLRLSEDEVAVLEGRTEGWIAGLQLAALAMQQREDHAAFVQTFGGSHRYLLDYFQEDILAHQSPQLQAFAIHTAILTRLNAALCQAVSGETASQEMLENMERANLFVVRLDEERRWYRFHELFRQTLLARLKTMQPELVPLLHSRAAYWYEAEGALREAIAHALAAEDFAFAASLMERAAEHIWMIEDAKMIHGWITLLPDAALCAHLPFALTTAVHLLHSIFGSSERKQRDAIGQTIIRVERLVSEANLSEAEKVLLRKRIQLFEIWIAASQDILDGDMPRLRQHSQEMQLLTFEDEVIWQMAPLFTSIIFCMNSLEDGRFLIPILLKAKQRAEGEQKHYELLRIKQWLAQVYWEFGEAHQAEHEGQETLFWLDQEGKQSLSIGGYLHLMLARIFWAWNQPEEAHIHLQSALQLAKSWQYLALLVECYDTYVTFSLDSGDLIAAEQALQEVKRLTQEHVIAIRLPHVMSTQVRLWLAQGNRGSLEAWATHRRPDLEKLGIASSWEESLALVRVQLVRQAYAEAEQMLPYLLSSAEQGNRTEKVAHILSLQVIVLEGQKKKEQAELVAARLLQLTEPEGFVRVYLNAGEPMRQTLWRIRDAQPMPQEVRFKASATYISTLLDAFERKKQKRVLQSASSIDGAEGSLSSDIHSVQTDLREALSPQEQRVLRLLVAGLTYAEMAQELVVSLNTIKTHVSSIYRKLDVSRRAEASAAAQRLHLL